MTDPKLPFLVLDEWQVPMAETLFLKRMRRAMFSYRGWIIAERFDDRYDTEVGGKQRMVTQWIDHKEDEPHNNELDAIKPKQSAKIVDRPPVILDYINGNHYTLGQAESMPELEPVTARLKERISEYEAHIKALDALSLKDIGYTDAHRKEIEQILRDQKQ